MTKQEKFELFLDAQIEKQRAVWFSCLPSIMIKMVDAINSVKVVLKDAEKMEKFENNTLSKLRPLYAEIGKIVTSPPQSFESEQKSRELVGQMITQLNGWFRSSKIAVGITVKMDPRYTGKASIAEKYDLSISNSL